MSVRPFGGKSPLIHETAFVADNAAVIGDVEIGAESSVWFGVTIRADYDKVRIGSRTNIQDGTVIHVDPAEPCVIGDEVTIGHNCCIHACTIGDGALIGMGSTVLNGAVIEPGGFVAAGSVVTPGTVVPTRSMVRGTPAKPWKDLPEGAEPGRDGAAHYADLAKRYRNEW